MNSRTIAWRNKPPQEIQETFTPASQLKLYLLQETGPTSFVFKDENENKIKLSIGREIICSCSPHRKDHCIHTLYVLHKIFKLEFENPLIWQGSYSDSEVGEILRYRYNPQDAQRPKRVQNFLKKSSNLRIKESKSKISRQQLGEDDVCPICHEDLKEEEGTTYCKKACGNNFHFKCILIWAEHRHNIGESISCPMCRSDWGSRAYENLVSEFTDFESRLILHKGHKCGACKNPGQKFIKGKLFHCMYCENYDLCEKCFLGFEHYEHNRYLMKDTINDNWRPAPNREEFVWNKEIKEDNEFQFIEEEKEQVQSHEEIALKKFYISCFPDSNLDFNLNINQGKNRMLAIVGQDVKKSCSYCHADKLSVSKLKRMPCGHIIHAHCILQMLDNRILKCPDDNADILKGYKSAFNIPKETASLNNLDNTQKDLNKKENKSNLKSLPGNKTGKIIGMTFKGPKKLAPIELDITGKAVITNEDNDMRGEEKVGDILKSQRAGLNPRNLGLKKPPLSSKLKKGDIVNEMALPMIGIQGTNFIGDEGGDQNTNKEPLKPLTNSLNNIDRKSNSEGKTGGKNFRISTTINRDINKRTRKADSSKEPRRTQSNKNQEIISLELCGQTKVLL